MTNKIRDVLERAFENKNSHNSTKSFSFKDGIFYSYKEPIAKIHLDKIIIYKKTAKDNNFFSMTTSKHIGTIKRYCEENNIDEYIITKNELLLEKINFTIENKKEMCMIDYEQYDEILKTKCGHYFSIENMYKWIITNSKSSCPYCRTEL